MIRPWHAWIACGFSFAVVLGAMGWVSLTVLDLERAQQESREEADMEERVRLALWRMDSALTPLLAQESMRPYVAYNAFYPAESLWACSPARTVRTSDLTPSPLLVQLPPHILLHFQLDARGRLSSPQVPMGEERVLAQNGCTTLDRVDAAASRLAELEKLVGRDTLLSALGNEPLSCPPGDLLPRRETPGRHALQAGQQSLQAEQVILNDNEWRARAQNRAVTVDQYAEENSMLPFYDAREALMTPHWIGSSLILVRRVTQGGQWVVQGCWLDWAEITNWLLTTVADLLPGASLQPSRSDAGTEGARLLAALPVSLIPGTVAIEASLLPSPLRLSLIVAWACVLLAAAAVTALLLGVMSLSERRAAFVSAVTHELRTPLTTFRMYSEILQRDMLPDEAKRKRYLETLSREANRLSHLVENVLEYARLENRGLESGRLLPVRLGDVFEHSQARLEERAAGAGMRLRLEIPEEMLSLSVRADPSAVEQILFNLTDNACKYARAAPEMLIRIGASRVDGQVALTVRDHGPGIARPDARRLFRPFCKSARDAASSAPGVGLGLALSRRLARSMGGNLRLDATVRDGAAFVLELPLSPEPARQ
ncbi:MAG TPA: HAMP domain-containing sensor histidine kinase [Planctomycetota bacterium]|nr:HAMP domain-containing sensor histidine kinase [Planctomycetota bacterium]